MVLGVLGFGLVRFTVHNASPANDSCYMHKDANNSARKPYIRMGGACGDRELIRDQTRQSSPKRYINPRNEGTFM